MHMYGANGNESNTVHFSQNGCYLSNYLRFHSDLHEPITRSDLMQPFAMLVPH